MLNLQRVTEIALGIAQEAGELALSYYGQASAQHKADGSLVTQADREAETLIRKRLAAAFPDHAVFGEEFGLGGAEDSDYMWYLDPVDGTSNFVYGLPIWGVSVGLTHRERPIAGVFVMPATGETYWAWEGGGAYQNGRRVFVDDPGEMRPTDLVIIASTICERYELGFRQKMRCLGSAAHALSAVAAGHFVAAVHDNWKPYDFAAALVMCKEAGVVVTDDEGRRFEGFSGMDRKGLGPTLVAAGPRLHPLVLEVVRRR